MRQQPFDVVLTDLNMQGLSGTELCERVVANVPDLPVVVVTAFGSMETAVAAIRAGAYDFITKPVEMDALVHTLTRAVQHHHLKGEVVRLQKVVTDSQSLGGLLGSSPPLLKVYELITRVADSDATVIIHGESGTGKELVARALHDKSRRASGPFVAVNCAAMPEALLESELFGHARGAFTDAKTARAGLFAQAHGARSCSTRWARCRSGSSPSCCAPSRSAACGRWAETTRWPSTCAWWPPPTGTWKAWWRRTASARTSTTGSTW